MYFGTDYHPEHWVYPYAGTPEEPENRWEEDAAGYEARLEAQVIGKLHGIDGLFVWYALMNHQLEDGDARAGLPDPRLGAP